MYPKNYCSTRRTCAFGAVSGFTLIELVIAMAVVALLAAVAIPAYNDFTSRGKLAEGMANLSNLRLQMEQYYSDNRTYRNAAGACAVADFNGNDFAFTCQTASATTFTWTATSLSGLGSGAYQYSIDQNGTRKTLKYDGAASASQCWEVRAGKCS